MRSRNFVYMHVTIKKNNRILHFLPLANYNRNISESLIRPNNIHIRSFAAALIKLMIIFVRISRRQAAKATKRKMIPTNACFAYVYMHALTRISKQKAHPLNAATAKIAKPQKLF